MNPGVWVVILLLVLSGCAPVNDKNMEETGMEGQPPPSAAESMMLNRLSLPATFVGSIPCEDCLRVDMVLNLRPDMLYQLRKTYMTRQGVLRVESQMRNWRYSSEGRMIILGKQKGMLKTYVVADQNTLVFLDVESEQGAEPIQYDLTRTQNYDPFRDNVKMRGMFSADESGATVAECSSGKVFGVSRQGEFETTVKEYLRLPHNPGEALLLSFEGTLNGTAEVESAAELITVNEFKRFYLNRNCLGQAVKASLTDTVWSLRSIGNRETNTFKYRSAPYLIMRRDNSLEAFGGCNTILGSYLVRGDVLLFDRMSQARVACFEGIELESLFLEVLDEAEFFKIEAQTMQLLDQDGDVLATFTGV